MEEKNPIPRHSRRLALKPHLPPEVTYGRRRQSRSVESSTIHTSGETSSFKLELAQIVSTHLGSFTVVEMESSQLPMVTIHSIAETIPP